MKSQPLLNRVRKAAATPTSAERIAMAQGHAAEQQAKVAPVRVFFALSPLLHFGLLLCGVPLRHRYALC